MASKAERIDVIMTQILLKHPFFGSVLIRAAPTPAASCQTLQTDGLKIYYSQAWLETQTRDVSIFGVVHEVLHIVLKHALRRGSRNSQLWNVACDYVINLALKDAGFTVWSECYIDEKYRDMSEEQVYVELQAEGGCSCGSGLGEDIIFSSFDVSTSESISQQVDSYIAAAAACAHAQGKMSAQLNLMIGNILNPKLSWEAILRNYLTSLVDDELTWARRNRRFRHVYLPGGRQDAAGEIVVIGDTSGSMVGAETISLMVGEIENLRVQLNPERVRIIWADDSECCAEQVFEQGEPIAAKPVGGGGTDMRKPLSFVERYDPLVVVLLTDGETPWPDGMTPYPLVVCCTTEQKCPAWADVVRVRP
jgi:predicted metal-dependent peptidase